MPRGEPTHLDFKGGLNMSSRPELSTGEALVGLLEAYGVDTIFGIPGVHNVEMYRALPRSKIKHVKEGTSVWEVEYRRMMDEIKRRKGV